MCIRDRASSSSYDWDTTEHQGTSSSYDWDTTRQNESSTYDPFTTDYPTTQHQGRPSYTQLYELYQLLAKVFDLVKQPNEEPSYEKFYELYYYFGIALSLAQQ